MMENKDMPAFPVLEQYEGGKFYIGPGLSKRELIAATVNISKEVCDDFGTPFFEELLGRKYDYKAPAIDKLKFWADAEASLRVAKADALLTELSKPQP